jgi:glutaredoxin
MNVSIISTQNCPHRSMLERQLKSKRILYTVKLVDENPELIEKYNIQSSLIIVVEDKVVFRPTCQKPFPIQDDLMKILKN